MEGKIILSKNKIGVTWNCNPNILEPFPIVFNKTINEELTLPIIKKKDVIEIQFHPTLKNNIFYCGEEELVLKNISKKISSSKKSSNEIISMDDSPIIIDITDSKMINFKYKVEDKPIIQSILDWDYKLSVLRNEQKNIVGIPNYEVWKELLPHKCNKKVEAELKWNNVVEKYQVNTIRKIL